MHVPMRLLTTAGVAQFVDSLRPGGRRDNCPPGCTLTPLLNGSAFAARGVDGAGLLNIVKMHEDGLPSSAVHNDTLRLAHVQWLETLGLLPPLVTAKKTAKEERLLALATRLKDAVHAQQKVDRRPARSQKRRLLTRAL